MVGVHVTSTCARPTDQARPQPAKKLPLTGGAGPEDGVWRAGTAPKTQTPAARRNGETPRDAADRYVRGAAKRATASNNRGEKDGYVGITPANAGGRR
ncbi:hypothetical protein HEK616_62930 [Streptomyces nigrescens]|uniref:Uncharacterized protein n=1 Tax=Streptomyces nigrescens TaxID=1920 RepID=A0ABM8A2B9_STRNI|nr:hypothetical protein HEK616_62930 [Streptomyces nigrescens]